MSSLWGCGKGAVTWGNGSTGTSGAIATTSSAGFAASLVGVGAGGYDGVGAQGIKVQIGGSNFLVNSPWFDLSSTQIDSGAATWMNGTTGALSNGLFGGTVSSANSLLGGTPTGYDNVGGATALNNGNFLAITPVWGSPSNAKGAVTWINGASGLLSDGSTGGTISSSNSLLGSTAGDMSGVSITQLGNGNILVKNSSWTANEGAVTWMNGASGLLANGSAGGPISIGNSVVGSTAGDIVGSSSIIEITDGTTFWNYIVHSPAWGGSGNPANALGAVTWINGTSGLLTNSNTGGAISSANSLVGSTAGDRIGYDGIVQLTGTMVVAHRARAQ